MADSAKTRLGVIEAPYGRRVWCDDVVYESGLRLLRMTIRKGARYTIFEMDAPTALAMSDMLSAWVATRPNAAP